MTEEVRNDSGFISVAKPALPLVKSLMPGPHAMKESVGEPTCLANL